MRSIVLVLAVITSINFAYAGDLEPSASPTTGTMKPLDQVEPRTAITSLPYEITTSGSYYITKNLTSAGQGITISVDDVSIDLCGFTLKGSDTASTVGIKMNARKNIFIHNGTIRDFESAIYDSALNANTRITGIIAFSNLRHGIFISGYNAQIRDCTIYQNGVGASGGSVYGIYAGWNCIVTGNSISFNGTSATGGAYVYGIYICMNGIVQGNTVYCNGTSAASCSVMGIYANSSDTIKGNTVSSNGTSATNCFGINVTANCNIIDNTLSDNKGKGIYGGLYSTLSGNNVNSSTTGIETGNHCMLSANTTFSNFGHGINAGQYCNVLNCTANSNTQNGINVGDYSTVSGCVTNNNTLIGISTGQKSNVTGNTVAVNGSWGIYCSSAYIAKNVVSQNNGSGTVGLGGIYAGSFSQVKENTLEGNAKNNIYIGGSRNAIESNVMSGSDYGINFATTGNWFGNNRATCNGSNYNATGNTDGGNVSF